MLPSERHSLEEFSRETIRPLALALGMLYLGFSVAHYLLMDSALKNVLFPLAVFTTVLYFAVYFFSRQILRHVRPTYIITALCWMVLLKSSLQLVLSKDIQNTVGLILIMFCFSSVAFSYPAYLMTAALVWMAFGISFQQTANLEQKMHFLLSLTAGSVLSFIVIALRIKTYRELISLTSEKRRITSMEMLSGGIVHELNTPLATLTLNAEMFGEELRKNPVDLSAANKRLEHVAATVARMSKLVHQLRLFAGDRLLAPEQKEIDLRNTTKAAMKVLSSLVQETGTKITLDFPNEPLKIKGDSSNLLTVFCDIIKNSIEAVRKLPDRWIIISGRDTGSSILITMTDSGKGIDPKTQARMFDPLFSTKKDLKAGIGFGLTIARSILKVHNAKISYDELKPNTTFILEFPYQADSVAKTKSA